MFREKTLEKTFVGAASVKQWGAVLPDGNSTIELVRFLVHRWVNHPSVIGKLQLFVAYEEKCICITVDFVRPIPALERNHEEVFFM